jgi:hypothetical protein
MPGVDMGTRQGRRLRDIVSDLASELGGVDRLGVIDLALVRQAAMDIMRQEQMSGALMRGETVDHEELTRAGNSARSALTKLGIKRAARVMSPPPTIAEIAARHRAQKVAAE